MELGNIDDDPNVDGRFDAVVFYEGASEGASLRIEAVQNVGARTNTKWRNVNVVPATTISYGSRRPRDGLNASEQSYDHDDDSFCSAMKRWC